MLILEMPWIFFFFGSNSLKNMEDLHEHLLMNVNVHIPGWKRPVRIGS